MSRGAPGVARTIALLDFLASRPGESFTLSDLARRLHLNKSTAHAMLTTLADAGYVMRHPVEKSYTLGPALVAIGRAAEGARPVELADYARDELRALADEFGVLCLASAVIGTEIVILAVSGQPEPFGQRVAVGQRLPYVPPLGTVFVAWSSPAEIDAWLRRVGPGATDEELARYRRAIDAVRSRGYSIGLAADAQVRLEQAVAARDPRLTPIVEELGHQEYILLELEHSASYRLSMIAAPVFDRDGQLVMALTLFGFPDPLGAMDLARAGERLVAGARSVTAKLRGVDPEHAKMARAG